MKKLLIPILLASIASLLATSFQSCNAAGCTDNKSALPLAGFYSYQTLEAITVDSISVGALNAPNDSLLLHTGTVRRLYMPFNIGENSTTYFIRYNKLALDFPEFYDTIKFNYSRVPYFASEECGAMYIYQITSVENTRHYIDSIWVKPLIDNVDAENIRIFFRTQTPDTNEDPEV
ncbi:MAG: DUF6452 family protein [Muribaculum sp.]|nr:DUF6452 family protein [Muribaculaceae bacterium]MCM1081618.1 DUF6452 family protein [Muribaculum sp.]